MASMFEMEKHARLEGSQAPAEDRRIRWLVIGALVSMFAVGARWDISLAAWIAPIFLIRYLRSSPAAAGIGAIWLVATANNIFWVVQLGAPIQPLSAAIILAVATMATLPFAVDRLWAFRFGPYARLFLFPAAFASAEFVMGTSSPLGTAFGMRAITQSDNLALLQLVALAGPYSIGFLINLLATTANWLWERPNSAAARLAGLLYAGLLLAIVAGGGARLAFSAVPDAYVRIAGITPDMFVQERARALLASPSRAPGTPAGAGPDKTFAGTGLLQSREEKDRLPMQRIGVAHRLVQDDLLARTREAARSGAKIVIWSETAASALDGAATRDLIARAADVAETEKIYINLAIGEPFAANQTVLLDPAGRQLWNYHKNYPVPGMEPLPVRRNAVPVISTSFGRLANVICFDADFPSLSRVDADIMIVPGFDWPKIGRTHTLKMANLRAIENGYALVRIAFHSQSAAFDHLGRILATQDTRSPGPHIMYADIPTSGHRTIYNRTGDLFAWLSLIGLLASVVLAIRPRPRS